MQPSTSTGALMANNNWEAWKRQARQLELELDAQLVAYSQLASTRSFGGGNVGGAPSQSAPLTQQSIDAHEYSIHQSLEKLGQVVNEMAAWLERQYPSSSNTTNPALMHVLQRHRDHLFDYQKEVQRAKRTLQQARDHEALMMGAKRAATHAGGGSSDTEMLLNERRKIDDVHRLTDTVIDNAYDARQSLMGQRSSLMNNSRRVGSVVQRFPILNTLLQNIQWRKRRDAYILGAVMATCVFLIYLYTSSG